MHLLLAKYIIDIPTHTRNIYIYTNSRSRHTAARIYIYIRRPLQSVEHVRLHLLAYNIQPKTSPTRRSKAQQRTSVQPAQLVRQLKSRNPTLRAPRQLESRIWVPGCLNLIILSSSIGDLLGCNSPPQVATGRQTLWPRIQQISLNRCSRLHRSAKLLNWVPCLSQSSPNAPTSLHGPSQVTPQVTQGLQKAAQIKATSATRQAKRQASKHPSLGS